MTASEAWLWRRFVRFFDRAFAPSFLVVWFGGLAVLLLLSISGADEKWGWDISKIGSWIFLTAIGAWMVMSGAGILLKQYLMSRRPRAEERSQAFSWFWYLTGILFAVGGCYLMWVLLSAPS